MEKEGCKKIYSIKEINIIGIFEVIKKIPKILKIRHKIIKYFINTKIDIFIGVDIPDFNLFIEKKLKKKKIKTVHYVSPSIWAWRKKRIIKMKKSLDLILILFPFEKKIYNHYKINYKFVGHHTADVIPLVPKKENAKKQLKIKKNTKCITILPGSRLSEIKNLSKIFLLSIKKTIKNIKKIKVLVLINNKECKKKFIKIYKKTTPKLPIKILNGKKKTALIASDVVLTKSGTITLECMLAKCPMIVGYKINKATYFLLKFFLKTPFISLPNILANKNIVKEFIQEHCEPKKISKSLKSLLMNKKNKKLYKIYLKIHKSIRCNASKQAAKAILKLK